MNQRIDLVKEKNLIQYAKRKMIGNNSLADLRIMTTIVMIRDIEVQYPETGSLK